MNKMLSGALELISGPLKNILDQLGGAKNELWLEIIQLMSRMKPERILAALKADMEVSVKTATFPVWKTLKLGTGLKTLDDFLSAFKASGNQIGEFGIKVFENPAFKVDDRESEVDLVIRTTAELGFNKGADYEHVFSRALELGLQLCSCEVGPELRLQYQDQSRDNHLLIAMKPISVSENDKRIFRVSNIKGVKLLVGEHVRPNDFSNSDDCWVFIQPRKVIQS